jgi:hypothetical protein
VPAEKKLMKRDKPFIHQGTAPPPAKKVLRFLADFPNDSPAAITPKVKINMTK